MHVCKETTQAQGKNNLKGLEKPLHGAHTGLKIVSVTTSQIVKAHNSGTSGELLGSVVNQL